MNFLSEKASKELKLEILNLVSSYLDSKFYSNNTLLGLVTRVTLQDELSISITTIKRWEELGLRRYQPPLDDSRTIFYRIDDVLKFLGVER